VRDFAPIPLKLPFIANALNDAFWSPNQPWEEWANLPQYQGLFKGNLAVENGSLSTWSTKQS
jgi:hypothetical protein